MAIRGAVSPVVFGGKIRAVQVYMDRQKMQARNLSPLDVMKAVNLSNIFLPTGEPIIGDMRLLPRQQLDVQGSGAAWGRSPCGPSTATAPSSATWPTPTDDAMIQTTIVRVDGRKQVVYPRDAAEGGQHAAGRSTTSRAAARDRERAEQAGDISK